MENGNALIRLEGVSKIFFKLKGPAAESEQALSEFKQLIAGARFE